MMGSGTVMQWEGTLNQQMLDLTPTRSLFPQATLVFLSPNWLCITHKSGGQGQLSENPSNKSLV